jgi:hypothetical protein
VKFIIMQFSPWSIFLPFKSYNQTLYVLHHQMQPFTSTTN